MLFQEVESTHQFCQTWIFCVRVDHVVDRPDRLTIPSVLKWLSCSPCYILPHYQMFAAYVLCGAQEKDAVRLTLEQIDIVRRMCTEYQDFELVTSVQGMVQLVMGLNIKYTE